MSLSLTPHFSWHTSGVAVWLWSWSFIDQEPNLGKPSHLLGWLAIVESVFGLDQMGPVHCFLKHFVSMNRIQCFPLIWGLAFCGFTYPLATTVWKYKWKIPEINNSWALNCVLFWVVWYNLPPFHSIPPRMESSLCPAYPCCAYVNHTCDTLRETTAKQFITIYCYPCSIIGYCC
jgi:hypothetical protein